MKMEIFLLCLFISFTNCIEDSCDKASHWCDNEVFDEVMPDIDESLNQLQQDDPKLIEIIKEKYLIRDYDKSQGVKLSRPGSKKSMKGQHDQPLIVDEIYNGHLKNGFFIEAGAFDGERYSNTLFFELKRNWTGLLVEPNPDYFSIMRKRNRNSFLFGHCLSTKTRPEVVHFDACGLTGGIMQPGKIKPGDDEFKDLMHRRTIKMQCFPLYSILMALGNPTVDYFSLDIEGAELPVLKTIPLDKVNISVMDIEVNHIGQIFDGQPEELKTYLEDNGYEFHQMADIDAIFVKKGIKEHFQKKKKKKKNIKKMDK